MKTAIYFAQKIDKVSKKKCCAVVNTILIQEKSPWKLLKILQVISILSIFKIPEPLYLCIWMKNEYADFSKF